MTQLYRKYRPKNYKQIVGNSKVIKALTNYEELPHAILLTGPKGCGKTTLARIIAKKVGCTGNDFVEQDTAIFRGIDSVRTIRKQMPFSPMNGKARVWLLDEAHMLGKGGSSKNNEAQNALLKALESCPDHVYFILCTTNPEMLISTIKSRCVQFEMSTLSDDEMGKLLFRVSKKEKKTIPDEVKEQIIHYSEGHPRNALNILDKVLMMEDEDEMLEAAKQAGEIKTAIKDLCYALLDMKPWKVVKGILKGLKDEQPETIRRSILGMMGSAILDGWGDHKKISPWYIMSWFYDKTTYDSGMAGIIFCCKAINKKMEGPY